MYREIKQCRICGNSNLDTVLNLGVQALTGVFPKRADETVSCGPLDLVRCREDDKGKFCGLLQLRHSHGLGEMFGTSYGYRSGLNPSMVAHLQEKAKRVFAAASPGPGDLLLDIGSSDGTLLQSYPRGDFILAGIDPVGEKFRKYYPPHITLIPDFFSAASVRARFGEKKAKVITSIAMFYDLDDPLQFMREAHELLAQEGVLVLEQSYMPTMLALNTYDTICHEHFEYYRLKQIKWMADRSGLKIIEVERNNVNGGSFSVMLAPAGSSYRENMVLVAEVLQEEEKQGLHTAGPYDEFRKRAWRHRGELRRLVRKIKSGGKTILGYGASTKGNVILQFCGFTKDDIPYIGEVNEDKFGCCTPGTGIPIVSEAEVKTMKPDYLLVLPWHFRDHFLQKEREYLNSGGRLVFPLPSLTIV